MSYTCKDCSWWKKGTARDNPSLEHGQCWLLPPKPTVVNGQVEQVRSETHKDESCGYWGKRW